MTPEYICFRQIRRSTTVPLILVDETSKDYANITLPYIQSVIGDGGSLQWVYNILDKKKEVERIVYDTGGTGPEDFIINIDTKWKTHPDPKETPREKWKDLVKPEDIYCLGIVQLRGLKSLRDLRGAAHLPLLRRLAGEGLSQVAALYSLPRGPGGGGGDGPASPARLRRQLRVFVHYQPQFYHFHVHYVHAANDLGATCDRAHLLTDVIQNLELDPDFYTTRTITHRLQVTDQLHLLRSQQQEGEKNT
uniref:Scavenger mRNA-decapping enzyme DcpS n=1 Tax=Heterosigma akashiwo TaxID=2829 RepID=A0A7S3XX35_HETAK